MLLKVDKMISLKLSDLARRFSETFSSVIFYMSTLMPLNTEQENGEYSLLFWFLLMVEFSIYI